MQQLFADVCIIFLLTQSHNCCKSAGDCNKLPAPDRFFSKTAVRKVVVKKAVVRKVVVGISIVRCVRIQKKPAVAAGLPDYTISEIT